MRYDDDSRFGGSLNPRFGGVFHLSADSSVKLLYGESYFAPSTYNMYQHYGSFNVGGGSTVSPFFHLPNSNLKPEKARTAELNWNQSLGSQMLLTVSTYFTRASDLILNRFNSSSTSFIGGTGTVTTSDQAQNIGTASFYGGYALINYIGSIDSFGIEPWLAYTYSDGAIDNGQGNSFAPPYNNTHTVKGGVTLKKGPFSLTPKFQALSETNHLYSDRVIPDIVPGFMLWDITLTAHNLVKDLDLTFDVRNLFDRRYFRPGSPNADTFGQSPQEPRTFQVAARYNF